MPVEDPDGGLNTEVYLTPGAALSSSRLGAPSRSVETPASYLIDPHTGDLPLQVWRAAGAIGFTCLEAAAYSTAALVRGTRATSWLTQLWVPARLISVDEDEQLTGNWAAHTQPLQPL